MSRNVSYLLTDEGWIEQRPVFLDSDEKEAKDSDEKEAKDSDEKEAKDSDEKEAKDSDEKEAKDSDEKEAKDSDEKEAKDSDEKEAKDSDEKEAKDSDEKEAKDSDEKEAKDSDEETIDCDCELLEDSIVKNMMKAVDSSNLVKPFVHPSKRLTSRSYVRKLMKLNPNDVPVEFENLTLDSMNALTASIILDSMLHSAGVVEVEEDTDYTRSPKKDFNF